ncbi:hypothetical protein AUR04nite_05570 [Glutamicibacter uratoxydans]|uniref:Uncharacterized protein n=1 Tax=Glutamicibacter uratoxydans TaxID=43667 RepID=A0A4Y4DMZ0_GLUUR|nr:hypothetical protein [Glutamicibacter uratoxydans]GED05025.1 hypothetical protein AUR04nite_05570 [Glutamicibacter uratoxydans]
MSKEPSPEINEQSSAREATGHLPNTSNNPLTEEELLREQEAESFPASDPPANY